MTDLGFWIACTVDGIATGFIYGLLALSIVLMYRTCKLFNFAQTSITALFMIFASNAAVKNNGVLVSIVTLLLGLIGGVLLHLVVMRRITENKDRSHATEALAIFGLMAVFEGLANFFFGDAPLPYPSLFVDGTLKISEFNLSYNSIGVACASIFVILLVGVFFRFTYIGLLSEAVAENILAARLRGIRASNILAIAWGVTGMVGVFVGILVSPVTFVWPGFLVPVFGSSLVAVVMGGLESPVGAVLCGILVGVVENLAANVEVLGTELKYVAVFLLLVTVLTLRPRGLFGRSDMRRV